MEDRIYIFNDSKILDKKIPLGVVGELNKIRPIWVDNILNSDAFLNPIVKDLFEHRRNQVNMDRLLEHINANENINSLWNIGKLMIVDEDFYSDDAENWCFGAFCPTSHGLGYILISTARLEDDSISKHILRHELGHMFGAPSNGRGNTEDSLGLHCINDLCTMQQKLTVDKMLNYAHKIENAKIFPYCSQCFNDIKNYIVH